MSDYNIPVSGGVNGLNVPLHGHIAVYNKEFPVIPNPEGEVTGYVTKLGFTPEILQVKDPEVHDWARAEEKPTYTKAEVGLGNVDNTSDLNKPISTATQTALDGKVDKVPGKELSTNDYTDTDKAIVDGVTSALATKVDKIAGKGLSSNDYTDYEKTKLAYIQSGAEANVQADWFESNRWSDAFILNKPTKLSDFSNDTGFITSTVDNLTYYYKKSETYTQAEVNALIGSIVTISFLVVQTLPQTGEANIIYLVPADEPNPDNIYEEYIYVNNNWEMIGTTKVDLSNYYTKTETDTLLNGKVDKDGNKVLSDNNYSDTDKTKLDGIEAEANKTVVDNSVTSTSTNPVESKAIYNLLNDLLPEATATGNPIAITNASGLNAKSLKVELEPIQDLHGYDSPWVEGSGYNKWDEEWESGSISGATGEPTPDDTSIRSKNFIKVSPSTQYYFFDKNSIRWDTFFYDTNKGILSNTGSSTSASFTTPANCEYVKFRMTTTSLSTGDVSINYPSSITTYYPYSNICPISGRTQTTVSANSEDTTIQFGQTVYGGEVDVTSGGTSSEYIDFNLSNFSWSEYSGLAYGHLFYTDNLVNEPIIYLPDTEPYGICETYNIVDNSSHVGAAGTPNELPISCARISVQKRIYIRVPDDWTITDVMASLNNAKLVILTTTPTTLTTPATPISLNKGNNTLTADGDMELKYSKTPQ